MKKNIFISAITTAILSTSAFAYTYEVKEGWNLLGATENISNFTNFSENGSTMWTYSNNAWTEVDLSSTSTIDKGNGFWFKANSDGSFETSTTNNINFTITSKAIEDGVILDDYKCEKKVDNIENIIPLEWSNMPQEAQSLAITMHHYPNPDDTTKIPNSYLLLWGIDTNTNQITHGEDNSNWYMGSNKDNNAISYTSPCSHSAGSHEYTITIYALSETPPSLPTNSTIDVTYDSLKSAIENVEVIDSATLTFIDTGAE